MEENRKYEQNLKKIEIEEKYKKPVTWWRYPVGIAACFAIMYFATDVITWIMNTFTFFISGFWGTILVLFGVSIATGIAFYALAIILPKHQDTIALIVFLIVLVLYAVAAVVFFIGQNPLAAVSYLIGIIAALWGWRTANRFKEG